MEANEASAAADEMQLLSLARQGQWDAFETLVARFQPRVFGLAWRILQQREDAEDVTQQTFLSVMEHLDSFREESSLATWILRIATNHALKLLRKRRGLATVPLETLGDSRGGDSDPLPHPDYIAQWHDDPADLAQRSEIRQLLNAALAEVDEKHRVVFVLRDIEGFSTQETADALGLSVANVKVRLLRARLQLRERLTRVLGDEASRVMPHQHDS
jgi:RNA polymerase sigma-70 factor, ECF subfamily